MQSANFALQARNYEVARLLLRQILMLPNSDLYLPTHEKAIAFSALVEEPTISEAQLELAEQTRRQALGESSLSLTANGSIQCALSGLACQYRTRQAVLRKLKRQPRELLLDGPKLESTNPGILKTLLAVAILNTK